LDEPYRVFISEDPIGLAGGINKYVYTLDDPVNWSDPSGLINWGQVGAGIIGQFAGYGLIGTGSGATATAAVLEGPAAAVHVGTDPGIVGMISFGGYTWWQGTKLIYEGFAEYKPPQPPRSGCSK
jgi:hypothetical protein